jgi:hypothetical protein
MTPTSKHFFTGAGLASDTAARVAEADPKRKAYHAVTIASSADNTHPFYIGSEPGVTADSGYLLEPGDDVRLEIEDVSDVWIIAPDGDADYSWVSV